jgi:hypothetical protein
MNAVPDSGVAQLKLPARLPPAFPCLSVRETSDNPTSTHSATSRLTRCQGVHAQGRAGQEPQRTRLRRDGAAGPELRTAALTIKGQANILGAPGGAAALAQDLSPLIP